MKLDDVKGQGVVCQHEAIGPTFPMLFDQLLLSRKISLKIANQIVLEWSIRFLWAGGRPLGFSHDLASQISSEFYKFYLQCYSHFNFWTSLSHGNTSTTHSVYPYPSWPMYINPWVNRWMPLWFWVQVRFWTPTGYLCHCLDLPAPKIPGTSL
jgi:hypothetical protein